MGDIRNAYLLIDNVDTISPEMAKVILNRVGNGTKIIMDGDGGSTDFSYPPTNQKGWDR